MQVVVFIVTSIILALIGIPLTRAVRDGHWWLLPVGAVFVFWFGYLMADADEKPEFIDFLRRLRRWFFR